MHKDYLSKLFSDANIPMFALDAAGTITHWNAEIANLLNVDSSDLTGMPIDTALHSMPHVSISEPVNVDALLRLELSELDLLYKGESKLPVKLKITFHAGPDDQHVLCIGHQIRQREDLTKVQEDQENKVLAFIRTSTEPIIEIDEQGAIIEWNPAMERATSYKKSEVLSKDLIAEFSLGEESEKLRQIFSQVMQGVFVPHFDLVLRTKTGGRVSLKANAYPRHNWRTERVNVVCVSQDQTEQKTESLRVIQTSKLATLGEMATSVAHELNQPLNVIRMASGNTLKRMDKLPLEESYLRKKLERINEQTERASAIINHMRMFGRNANEAPAPIQPRLAILGAIDLIGEQLRLSEIDLKIDSIDVPLWVEGHQIQLEQVLINLLTNARDAISLNPAGEKYISIKLNARDGQVHLSVEDTGGGIPEAAIDRLYEPFFTTKELGSGTGLGLSVSYGIIQEMGGRIDAENINKGARFNILLPLLNDAID